MAEHLMTSITTVILAIVGIAMVAVLVSRNAQTPQVLGSASQAFSQSLGTALSPITGGALGFTGLPPISVGA